MKKDDEIRIGRRKLLTRFGLIGAAAYIVPTLTTLSTAHASSSSGATDASDASDASDPSGGVGPV